MKKIMYCVTAILTVLFLLSVILYIKTNSVILFSLAITLGTTWYHFFMRLFVGLCFHAVFRGNMNHRHRWFREHRFEPSLYRFLRVKAWKKHIPTFDPKLYSLKEHTPIELVGATCQAEVVHETIFLLSFLPLFLIIPFGEPLVFILTSVIAALVDTVFIILQRFNRPRLLRLIK